MINRFAAVLFATVMVAAQPASAEDKIADVTDTAVRRELQKIQNTNPENRHAYSPA